MILFTCTCHVYKACVNFEEISFGSYIEYAIWGFSLTKKLNTNAKIEVTLDYITGTKVEDAKALMAASSLKIMADDNLDAAAATVRGIGMLF